MANPGDYAESECDCVKAIIEPPPQVNEIIFVITIGDDALRGDSSVSATLLGVNGATLDVLTVKSQKDPGSAESTTNTVTLRGIAFAIERIVLTLTSHNSIFPPEADDNWNIQNVYVSFGEWLTTVRR